jgi:hypothetical protein
MLGHGAGSDTQHIRGEQQGYRGCAGCSFPLLHPTSMNYYFYTCQPCNAMGSGCNMCDCAGHCQSCAFGFTRYYDGCIEGIPLSTFQNPQGPSAAPTPAASPIQATAASALPEQVAAPGDESVSVRAEDREGVVQMVGSEL